MSGHRQGLTLRRHTSRLLTVALLMLGCAPELPGAADRSRDAIAERLVTLTNRDRGERGLPPLKLNEHLNRAALLKAKDMAERGYYDHVDPDGRMPWTWLTSVGYSYSFAAENLMRGLDDPELIQTRWMGSRIHRDNVLSPNFTEMGVAVVATAHRSPLVVVFFARPGLWGNGER